MQDQEPSNSTRAALSALMDGDQTAVDDACRAWRGDAAARDDWHTYHLIGDLLRSDEHHCEPARDAVFVARLHDRLSAEPIVLAPQSKAGASLARARRLRAWMVPGAVAAGFVAVAGALVVTRVSLPESGDSGERVAQSVGAGAAPAALVAASAGQGSASSVMLVPTENATLIRSSELDRYLAAHRQNANTAAPGASMGAVQNVSVAGPGR